MITINKHDYAEPGEPLLPSHYGYVKRYSDKMEFYNLEKSPLFAINSHAVSFLFEIQNGKKMYKMLYRDHPIYQIVGNDVQNDVRKACVQRIEKYVDTRKYGGMFSAFPDHTYRFTE
jgi:hypothetical protein